MAGLIWIIAGIVVVGAAALWALLRGQSRSNRDLGTISSQWKAERRSHEREAGDRGGRPNATPSSSNPGV